MNKIIVLFAVIVLLTGCAKLAHINELLTLKAMSDEQARNDKIVKEYDARFSALVDAQKNNQLTQETKKSILGKFTKPIYTETITLQGSQVDRWIYRPYVKYFDSELVYLYFDADGKLIKSEYLPPPEKKSNGASDAKASNPAS